MDLASLRAPSPRTAHPAPQLPGCGKLTDYEEVCAGAVPESGGNFRNGYAIHFPCVHTKISSIEDVKGKRYSIRFNFAKWYVRSWPDVAWSSVARCDVLRRSVGCFTSALRRRANWSCAIPRRLGCRPLLVSPLAIAFTLLPDRCCLWRSHCYEVT